MSKVRGYLLTSLSTILVCVILGIVFVPMFVRDAIDTAMAKHVEEVASKESEVVVTNNSTGTETTLSTGGERNITTEDGKDITYHIPTDHYDITDSYFELLSTGTGMSITDDATVICGNTPTVADATQSVTATPYSSLYSVFTSLYGEEVLLEDIYTPAYTLHSSGTLPTELPLNYTAEVYGDTIKHDGVTYTVYNVNYDDDQTDYTVAEPEEVIVHVQQLTAFSDTNDVIEISVFDANADLEVEYELLKKFITGE